MKFKEIPVEQIDEGFNVRTEADEELGGLMETIERYDVLQPLLVVPKNGRYELVSGHRRLHALRDRNEATAPCVIREDLSEGDVLFVRLIENIQRKQLSTHELIEICEKMMREDPRLTKSRIALMLGKPPAWLSGKYQVDRIIEQLLELDVPMESINEMNDSTIRKLAWVKKKEERADIARGRLSGGKPPTELTIRRADSFEKEERGRYRKDYSRRYGITVLLMGKHDLVVTCKTLAKRNEVESLIYGHLLEMFQADGIIESRRNGLSDDAKVCESCGNFYRAAYRVPDRVWGLISPRGRDGKGLCPGCADRRAREQGIKLRWQATEDTAS